MIELIGVSFGYGSTKIIDDLNLTLPENEVTFISGVSGSGKSTLIKLIAGIIVPERGRIAGLEGKRVSAVFQEDRLLAWLTVHDNVALVNDRGDAGKWIEAVEMTEFSGRKAAELSGGQQRRTAIARALNFGGELLLMDEPFTGLDDALKQRLIVRIREEFPTIVIATHDSSEAEALCAVNRVQLTV